MLAYLGHGGTRGRRATRSARRWRDDLGQLAPAAHRDADRGRDPRPDRGAARPDRDRDGQRLPPRRPRRLPRARPSTDGCGQAIEAFTAALPSGSAASLGWLTLVPGLIGVAARSAVRARARERHLPARLDAERHPPPLDRDQARRRRRRGASQRARAHPAHDLVAHAARPPPRADGRQRLRLRGHRRVRLHAVRARARPRRRRRLAPRRPRGRRRRSPATSPRGSSSTPGCANASSARSQPPGAPSLPEPPGRPAPRRPRASTTPG